MQRATLFNPIDDSLETKVKSVRDVQKAYLGIKASLEYSKVKGYNQALGTKEELDKAYILTKDSFKQAVKSMSDSDLKKARSEKLISTEEFQKLSVEKHKTKVNFIRSNQMSPEDKQNVKGHNPPHSHKK
jgi:Na+/phosphate symporter